jgi:hypothetical protein
LDRVSTRSAGRAPAGAISELGLPARAVTALSRAGVTSTADLAALTRRELAAVPGLGAGMIAAIRAVVPEPGRSGDVPPVPDPEAESPAAPAIPSFASMRAPQRRTAMDLLVPGHPAGPEDAPPGPPGPPTAPTAPSAPEPPRAPRPAEYGDLLRIGSHLARAVAGVPVRAVRWSLCQPVRVLRRLLG